MAATRSICILEIVVIVVVTGSFARLSTTFEKGRIVLFGIGKLLKE
jgi:hypothetical protein